MADNIAQIHVRRQRKKLTVIGMGQTNRGQKYIKKSVELECSKIKDPKFKDELSTAVEEILG